MLLWRSIVAFLALPGTVAFIVPLCVVMSSGSLRAFDSVSLPFLAVGVVLLGWCVHDFYVTGRGTLAPWSPPRHLVTVGAYRFSRNPMYVAVVLILSGWAIGFHSILLAIYATVMATAFHLRVILHEEPWLERRFGEQWLHYKGKVPRWIGPMFQRRRTSA